MNRLVRLACAATACTAIACVAGCGLKGPLTMPERSSNVVIRGPSGEVVDAPGSGGTAPASGAPATAPPTDTAAPATPTPAEKKPPTASDRMPPPPLPGGNPGSTQGG